MGRKLGEFPGLLYAWLDCRLSEFRGRIEEVSTEGVWELGLIVRRCLARLGFL